MALGKKLRNRLVGLLVLVSVAMILVPAIMDPGQVYRKSSDTIAVDGNGAVTDQNGRMMQGGDYSDLLAPVEGNGITPEQLAAQNSKKTEPVAETDEMISPSDQGTLDSFDDGPFASDPVAVNRVPQNALSNGGSEVEQLKRARETGSGPTPKGNAAATSSQISSANGVEILKSSRSKDQSAAPKNTNSERLVSSRTNKDQQKRNASGSQGSYTVQVGVFSSKANADGVISKLKAAGISARQVPAVINGRNLIRVYAGSASTREGAEGIARRVQQVTGTKGSVINTAN